MILNFGQFISESSEKHVVMAYGRANPVTPGHVKLFDTTKSTAKKLGADHEVVLTRSHDPEKNPLTPQQKLRHAKAASPGTNITVSDEDHPNLIHHAVRMHKKGYTHLTVVAGADRADTFKSYLDRYNGVKSKHGYYKFKSINVVSAGHRDPDSDSVEGASGTKQRAHAEAGRKKEFMSGVPKGVDGEKMYSDVRKGMGIK